jgi:hypothetical protein
MQLRQKLKWSKPLCMNWFVACIYVYHKMHSRSCFLKAKLKLDFQRKAFNSLPEPARNDLISHSRMKEEGLQLSL